MQIRHNSDFQKRCLPLRIISYKDILRVTAWTSTHAPAVWRETTALSGYGDCGRTHRTFPLRVDGSRPKVYRGARQTSIAAPRSMAATHPPLAPSLAVCIQLPNREDT